MPPVRTLLSATTVLALSTALNLGATDVPRHYEIPKVEGKIVVDAKLDEPQWQDAVLIEAPVETTPGNNIPTDIRTECLLMYDNSHLYFGCRAFDPDPSQIRAFITDRDQMGVRFHGSFWPLRTLELRLHGSLGDQVDYANVQPGEEVQLETGLSWRPGKHWGIDLDHEYRSLDVEDGRLFTANLSQMRLVYYLNVRTFLRAILQYTDVERDPTLYDDEVEAHESRLFSQLLFSYKLNARTVVFVGYSDTSRSNDSFDDVIMNRSVFIKLGYAWLL